jgi:hypothetical protein
MLLKLWNRPERRSQAAPLAGCRERHGLQARREDHDNARRNRARTACRTRSLCGAGDERREHRGLRAYAPFLRHGAFLMHGSGRPDSAASAAPRRQQLGLRNCQARRPKASRDMTGGAGYSE